LRKKREFNEGEFYHVTSRTNDKIRVFENRLGLKIMLILSAIMQWIKVNSAKYWNLIHGSNDHLWGHRYFARAIKNQTEYEFVMNYIDQNPVVVGLASTPADWKASGAYYKARNIPGLVDFEHLDRQPHTKLLPPIPSNVSILIPSAQLEHTLRYFGAYSEAIDKLYALVPTIPRIGESAFLREPPICLYYYSHTADYFIYEYDGLDTMYGLVRFYVFPAINEYRKISLSGLKNNQNIKIDFSWEV